MEKNVFVEIKLVYRSQLVPSAQWHTRETVCWDVVVSARLIEAENSDEIDASSESQSRGS